MTIVNYRVHLLFKFSSKKMIIFSKYKLKLEGDYNKKDDYCLSTDGKKIHIVIYECKKF